MLEILLTKITTVVVPAFVSLLALGVVITIHEFGHFVFCKLFGVGTPIFSVGFGPTLLHTKIGKTDFRLALIPLGGYCAIEEGGKRGENPDSFTFKPYWQKFMVIIGGILFNLLFAYASFTFLNMGTVQEVRDTISLQSVSPGGSAAEAGLLPGDIITGYNKTLFSQQPATTNSELRAFLQYIGEHSGEKLDLNIIRSGKKQTITTTLQNKNGRGALGVQLDVIHTPVPGLFHHHTFFQALCKGIDYVNSWIVQTTQTLHAVFVRGAITSIGGPVMLVSQGFKVAQNGIVALIAFMGIVSISLAIMNILPLIPLDGGQLVLITLEAIIGRPLEEKTKEWIAIGAQLLFLTLILFITYKDILRVLGY